jgi:outer membrane lipoprotein carrier protein
MAAMKLRTICLVLIMGMTFATAVPRMRAAVIPPEEAAARIEARLRSLKSIRSEYEHLYYSMTASEPLREKGTLYFQKPDRMRWDSTEPEKQTFLYSGGTYSFYVPEEKQLIRRRGSKDRSESEILALFSGAKAIRDSYAVESSAFPRDNARAVQLKLTPREEGEFTYILLETDPGSWLIQKAVFFDWSGNKQEFRFTGIKVDLRLTPEIFELKVPPDTEIIEDEVRPGR